MSSGKTWRFERLFAEKSAAVQAFFRRRLRPSSANDALDLTQEVYSRVLNAGRLRTIEDPEAYLFTVARHLLEEHAVAQRRQARRIDASDPLIAAELSVEETFDRDIDRETFARILREGMDELPPPCRAAVVLAYEDGLSYREIAEQLGVSKPMVQKYIAQTISYCRQKVLRGSRPSNRQGASR